MIIIMIIIIIIIILIGVTIAIFSKTKSISSNGGTKEGLELLHNHNKAATEVFSNG